MFLLADCVLGLEDEPIIYCEQTMKLNRQMIGLEAATCCIFLAVFVRALFGSKMPFVLVVSSMSAFGHLCGVAQGSLYNWQYFGVTQKNMSPAALPHINLSLDILMGVGNYCFYTSMWIFAWRYWKVT